MMSRWPNLGSKRYSMCNVIRYNISCADLGTAVQLYLFSDDGTEVSNTSTVTSETIDSTMATVLSSITGTIRAAAEDGCSIDVINAVSVRSCVGFKRFVPVLRFSWNTF